MVFDHIDKRFGAVHANRSIHLAIARGDIHALVGENGAGKSTLMSILFGFYQADSGRILIDGQESKITSPSDAIASGIGMVHQHFMLVEPMSVADNLMLGHEGGFALAGGRKALLAKLDALARDYDLTIEPDAIVSDLPVGLQQRVELLKSLVRDADILVLDEPTAVLTPGEADRLFALLRDLKARGKTIILITHKLREVMEIADRVSVLRQGACVGTYPIVDTNEAALAEAMIGRRVHMPERADTLADDEPLLTVEALCVRDARGGMAVKDVSLMVRPGEILGIAGVAGNGQTELLEALAGLRAATSGSIRFKNSDISHATPADLHALGIRHIPEDRLRYALAYPFAVWENCLIGADDEQGSLIARQTVMGDAARLMQAYDVRPADPLLRAGALSGGNQQKLVLGREIEQRPRLLLVGQPTRGVDIGAIAFIHRRLLDLRAQGVAILLVSVELDEILRLSDRILVMQEGRIAGERRAGETDERDLGLLMAGIA
ncbi:ABC transporter ATP-binding protein [Rhizobiales bacterium TNE-4]|nr:ABC transporter ATP-binding protein [Rhizobiales bacterium TNE-4]MBV1828529.1 ABC transporter ATP-binding protein [Rhizobiales bacterium TNE-4]